jgi:nitrate/nitrite transporter NarK
LHRRLRLCRLAGAADGRRARRFDRRREDAVGVFIVAALALAGVSGATTLPMALALFVLAMLALGTGNGAVFQLVPQRFRPRSG